MIRRLRKDRVVKKSSAPKRVLSFWFDRTITKEDGKWVARSHLVRFAAYGDSKASALGRLQRGIEFIVNSLGNRRGAEEVLAWLDSHDITHSFSSEAITEDGGVRMRMFVKV